MSATEMAKAIEGLREELAKRDRLLRMAYYAVSQIRNFKNDRLRAEMAQWAPMPRGREM